MYHGFAKTRKETVSLARRIANEFGLFHHVTGDHAFSDGYLFFRFKETDDEASNNSSVNSHSLADTNLSMNSKSELGEKAEKLKECVDVRDRTYRMKTHKHCFIGAEAVDAMVYTGLAGSREEAVTLAKTLEGELRLFQPVNGDHSFEDEYLFYRFREKNAISSGRGEHSTSTDTASVNLEMHEKARAFRQCVDIRDRRYRLRTYKKCFIGCDAVDSIVERGLAKSRTEAVELGRALARELGLFQHVTGDHAFCDDYLFFRFSDNASLTGLHLPTLAENGEAEGAGGSEDSSIEIVGEDAV